MTTETIFDYLGLDGEDGLPPTDRLIDHSFEILRKMVRRMLKSFPNVHRWEDTDDVLQISALRFHKAISKNSPDSPKHFFRLAGVLIRQTLIDLSRKHSRSNGYGANHDTNVGIELRAVATPRSGQREEPYGLMDWADFHRQIEQLPEKEREVFDLLWYGGLSQSEAAMILGLEIRTIQRRWRQARILLHQRRSGVCPD